MLSIKKDHEGDQDAQPQTPFASGEPESNPESGSGKLSIGLSEKSDDKPSEHIPGNIPAEPSGEPPKKKKKLSRNRVILLASIFTLALAYAVYFHFGEYKAKVQREKEKEEFKHQVEENRKKAEAARVVAEKRKKEQQALAAKRAAEMRKKAEIVRKAMEAEKKRLTAAAAKRAEEAALRKQKEDAEKERKAIIAKKNDIIKGYAVIEKKRKLLQKQKERDAFIESFKGDITTKSGKTYKGVSIINVGKRGIDVSFAGGVKYIKASQLPDKMRDVLMLKKKVRKKKRGKKAKKSS